MREKKFKSILSVFMILLLLVFCFPNMAIVANAGGLPELTITEILANSNGDGTSTTDLYEYVEVKNNTSNAINLAGYKFDVWWRPASVEHWDMTASKTVPAGGIMVIWIKNTYSNSAGKTETDFLNHYPGLASTQLYTLDIGSSGAVANSGINKYILMKDDGTEVCIARYNDSTWNNTTTTEDTSVENSSIVYEFPSNPVNGYKTVKKAAVKQTPTPGYTGSQPGIWITELMPNPNVSTTDTTDMYEYIELYNNTNSPINLQSYKIVYYYNSSGYDTYDLNISKSIPAKDYMVIWVMSSASAGKTLADFNAHWNTNIPDSQMYYLNASGIGSTGKKTIILSTDGGTQTCKAIYNDGTSNDNTATVDTAENTSIIYEPPVDGSIQMRKVANTQYATPGEGLNWFTGQIHAHTGYSDGQNTPDYAYSYARDTANVDFFGLSEHSEHVNLTSAAWDDLRLQADTHTGNNSFVGLAGDEMTWDTDTGIWGHMNTFNTEGWYEKATHEAMDLQDYYTELKKRPEGISQFNHPMEYWGTFNDFSYRDDDIDGVVPALEINDDQVESINEKYNNYIRALDKGWHVAPTFNDDNHAANWCTSTSNRTVVLASRLTRDNILDAIRNRRFFANYGDADFRMMYKVNGQPMGSRLTNPGTLNLSVWAFNPTDDPISKISIISNGGRVVASQIYNSRTAAFNTTLSPEYKYYFVRVDQVDGDYSVSAPVWIEDAVPVQLTMSTQETLTPNVPVKINAVVKNTGSTTLSNVDVKFYKNDYQSTQLGSAVIASIPANGTGNASLEWVPDVTGNYKICAQATTNVNGINKTITASIIIPKMLITELAVNSAGAPDEYDYVEVYNNSKGSINLKDYKFQFYYNYFTDITTDFIIPAKSAAILWIKPGTRTLADFNAHYGTNFAANQVLKISIIHNETGKEGDLTNIGAGWVTLTKDTGEDIITARFNEGILNHPEGDPNIVEGYSEDANVDGRSINYSYPDDGKINMKKTGVNQPHTPGNPSNQ